MSEQLVMLKEFMDFMREKKKYRSLNLSKNKDNRSTVIEKKGNGRKLKRKSYI